MQIIKGGGNPAPTLGHIVGFFKYQTSKQINIIRETPGQKLWQRNYYEHIIRDECDYNRIYEYIQNNPLKWKLDSLHPANHEKIKRKTSTGNPAPLQGRVGRLGHHLPDKESLKKQLEEAQAEWERSSG